MGVLRSEDEIRSERLRQMMEEGHSPEYDDMAHADGSLEQMARAYEAAAMLQLRGTTDRHQLLRQPPAAWPNGLRPWKPKDWRRNAVRAGALYLAEQERLTRTGGSHVAIVTMRVCVKRMAVLIEDVDSFAALVPGNAA